MLYDKKAKSLKDKILEDEAKRVEELKAKKLKDTKKVEKSNKSNKSKRK